jgi:hypothetical protein
MPWSRAFDDPIQPPKGKPLVTLKDAAGLHHGAAGGRTARPGMAGGRGGGAHAAEDRGPLMHAHVGMMLALHGAKPIPEYDPSKTKRWGRRKLKRDE